MNFVFFSSNFSSFLSGHGIVTEIPHWKFTGLWRWFVGYNKFASLNYRINNQLKMLFRSSECVQSNLQFGKFSHRWTIRRIYQLCPTNSANPQFAISAKCNANFRRSNSISGHFICQYHRIRWHWNYWTHQWQLHRIPKPITLERMLWKRFKSIE